MTMPGPVIIWLYGPDHDTVGWLSDGHSADQIREIQSLIRDATDFDDVERRLMAAGFEVLNWIGKGYEEPDDRIE